jgi:hypothetical protein
MLHTIWNGWPLHERDLGRFALFVVHALGGLGMLGWSLRSLHKEEAMGRQWTLQKSRHGKR